MEQPTDLQLSVIIVNYNVKYFLEQALLSVRRATTHLSTEVFVVDNNSVDESVQMVKEKFPEVHLIANKNNVGFSKANNQAIAIAKGKYILLLNPDTVVKEDTFDKCVQFMEEHPDAGGLGVKMIDGSGKFLPESKRGFPSPFVAFCKTFGLSSIFPKSKLFNRYHLGFLDEDETHEIDVLAGAFMLMRKSVLDQVGWLDEAFFMYGEDIDLSYRIVKGGYKNYYFADTTIIHYKGESTKRGSLNYVRTFYQAMIIFAKKHFKGQQAKGFVLMLQMAIYFRAFLTLITNISKKALLPFIDAIVIYIGLYFLKNFWATYYFKDPNYYDDAFLYINAPLYIFLWLTGVYFSGGYDEGGGTRRLVRGILVGTVFLAAVYGFLDMEYRSSRALIVLGAIWALVATISLRAIAHFWRYGNFDIGQEKPKNLIIVGSEEESKRVQQLLHQAQVFKNLIGTVSAEENHDANTYLGGVYQLEEVVHVFKIDEIIFCSKNISAQEIMQWMTRLGPGLEYKIVPEESLSIIGSSSKNSAGELYTIDIQFNIAHARHRRNKRLMDLSLALFYLLSFPLQLLIVRKPWSFLQNCWKVLLGQRTWVGYHKVEGQSIELPALSTGILSPKDALQIHNLNNPTIQRLNFLYAKDYQVSKDLEIIWNAYRMQGRSR